MLAATLERPVDVISVRLRLPLRMCGSACPFRVHDAESESSPWPNHVTLLGTFATTTRNAVG